MLTIETVLTKRCSKCGIEREATAGNFSWRKPRKGRSGRWEGPCHPCNRAHVLSWRMENPEKAQAADRAKYERNRDAVIQRVAEYQKDNREVCNERKRAWRDRDIERHREAARRRREDRRDEIREYWRNWAAANPDKVRASSRRSYVRNREALLAWGRAYRLAFPEKAMARVRAYRARKRGAAGRHTDADIKRQLAGQRGLCWWCCRKVGKYHVDHRIPLARGGSNGPENIVISCPQCNQRKNAKMPWEMEVPRLL
ncbi:HNH endonuclease [Sphingomonas sp. 1P06PA]|uniref:HNH endonuclease n=1 Tax=Sphingomonas sp. 1P06PA TaxID=554121 RepID=UPI0039A73F98